MGMGQGIRAGLEYGGITCVLQSQFSRVFRTPEHEVLMVSYCDQSLSVVRALSTFCFKRLLLQNR